MPKMNGPAGISSRLEFKIPVSLLVTLKKMVYYLLIFFLPASFETAITNNSQLAVEQS